jgi:chromosome segregation ATPase
MENGHEPASKADISALKADTSALKADTSALKADTSALKADTSALKADISTLKADIRTVRAELDEKIEMVRAEMNHGYHDLKETLRDVQTEILKAFYGYTQTTDVKLKEGETSDIGLRQRLTVVESRLLEVERRLNMPPQPQ